MLLARVIPDSLQYRKQNHLILEQGLALMGVAQLVGHRPAELTVTGSISDPSSINQPMFLSLSPSLLSLLYKNK